MVAKPTWLASFLLCVMLGRGVMAQDVDPTLPYQARLSEPVTYDVDFSVVVTAPYHTKKLRVWLPLPRSDEAQQISRRELSTFPLAVKPQIAKEPVYGNEFAYFEFDHPEGGQIIRHRFQVKVHELHWNVAPQQVDKVVKWPSSFDPYFRRATSLAEEQALQETLQQITRATRERPDLFTVMNWVDRNITYDHVNASLKADTLFALQNRRGHCSDYHGLCATMGQAIGYPTRVTYGINLFPKNSPSHCKLEAFLPPYGWVSFDVSETQRLVETIQKDKKLTEPRKEELTQSARQRFQRGFRDNTWLLLTKGTDYQLVPPASKHVAVVRTIYAEADGEPLPDPDPANPEKREFGWMTVHQYKADRQVPYPFKDWRTLEGPARN